MVCQLRIREDIRLAGGRMGRYRDYYSDDFINHNYYHEWYQIDGIRRTTPKAILIEVNGLSMWVPRSLIRETRERKTQILVHGETFQKIYNKALEDAEKPKNNTTFNSPFLKQHLRK